MPSNPAEGNRVVKPRRNIVQVPVRDTAEALPVPIIADGAIATVHWGEGRTIPVLIIDTSTRPDVENFIGSQHRTQIVGDAESMWSFNKRPRGLPRPLLLLNFTKPTQCLLIIEFEIPRQGVLVDQILWSHGLYLQPGRPGERLSATLENPRLIIEVPPNEIFRGEFESVYKKAIFRHFRREGMSRTHAKKGVDSYLRKQRDVFRRRVPFRRPSDDTVSE